MDADKTKIRYRSRHVLGGSKEMVSVLSLGDIEHGILFREGGEGAIPNGWQIYARDLGSGVSVGPDGAKAEMFEGDVVLYAAVFRRKPEDYTPERDVVGPDGWAYEEVDRLGVVEYSGGKFVLAMYNGGRLAQVAPVSKLQRDSWKNGVRMDGDSEDLKDFRLADGVYVMRAGPTQKGQDARLKFIAELEKKLCPRQEWKPSLIFKTGSPGVARR